MGSATARTSSMSGEYLPLSNALHLAPTIRCWEARGPAPHSSSCVARAAARSVFGPGFVHQAYGVLHYVVGYGHAAHQMLKRLNFAGVQYFAYRGLVVGGRVFYDLQLGFIAGVAELEC